MNQLLIDCQQIQIPPKFKCPKNSSYTSYMLITKIPEDTTYTKILYIYIYIYIYNNYSEWAGWHKANLSGV